jgi:nucleoside 2-deoxyribosyltransferase
MDFVKERIATSDFVIADLTTANPNVYLEVGYAWGLKKKTVLLIKDPKELKFDIRGQRCLPYTSIKDLENKLKNELTNLKL